VAWARLDDRFHENRKVKKAWRRCPTAIGLHVMAITYCSGHLTDGLVDIEFVEEKIPKDRDRTAAVAALVDAGLWEPVDDGWRIHDFLEFNPSSEQLAEAKRAKSAAGKKGASARWGNGKRKAGSLADAITPAMAPAIGGASGVAMADDAPEPDPNPTHYPPTPPRGARKRDREAYDQEVKAYAARLLPDIHPDFAELAVGKALQVLGDHDQPTDAQVLDTASRLRMLPDEIRDAIARQIPEAA
jgi:hypothetical protein